MKIKTVLTCAGALLLGGLHAQCFTLSDNVGGQICLGASAQLSATPGSTCGAMTFSWYPWGHIGTNYVITPTVTTTYTVIASNSSTLTGTIVVNPLPTIGLSPNPPLIVCTGPVITSTISISGASTYTWIPNNSPIWSGALYVTPIASTIYSVAGTDGNGCVNTGTVEVKYDNSMCPCVGCGATVPATLTGGTVSGPNCVNNDVLITGPVTINNADFSIGTGVKITIAATGNLLINNSHLFACNNMWQGIVIQNGGMLTIKQSLIEDATEAIDVTNNINQSIIFDIDQTTFNKNNVSIDIENYTEQIPSYPFILRNSLFTCRDIPFTPMSFPPTSAIASPAANPEAPLSNPYIDNNIYPQANTASYLKLPYTGLKPEAGIRLKNVGITLNPNSGSTVFYQWEHGSPGSQVFFDNLGAGMDLYNANVSVHNSVFQNSNIGIKCDAANNSHNSLEVTSPAGTQNQFVDCQTGVYDRWYYNLAITDADFRTTWGSTLNQVSVPNAIDVWTNRYRDCRIEDNTIYNVNQAIGITAISNVPLFMPGIYNGGYWGQFAGSMLINRNNIANNAPGNPTSYQQLVTGINMQMYATQWYLYLADPTTQIVQVDKNEILNTEIGIHMSLWQWLNQSYNSNTITLVPPVNFGASGYGIGLVIDKGTATQPTQIANNMITGYGFNVTPPSYGMRLGGGQYQDFTCNYVSNVSYGYEFSTSNPNINFTNNDMNTNLYGLMIAGGDIGTQGSPTNPQDNTWSGFWPLGTYKTALLSGADAANSRLYIRSSSPGPFNPDGYSISTTVPTSLTNHALSNGNLIVSASAPPLGFCPIVPSTARLAQGNVAPDADQLMSFVRRKSNVDPSIDFIKRTLLYELANSQGYHPTGQDSLSDFYLKQQAGNIGLFEKIEKALASQNLGEASHLNESVKASNEAEENTRLYYRLALNHFNGSFNQKDSAVLCKLVTKCPYTEGLAIEKARVLYTIRFGWKLFGDNCSSKQDAALLGMKETLLQSVSVQLYPNPTSGYVNVLAPGFGDGPVEINVLDVSGRCIYKATHQFLAGKTGFSLDYASGAYFVTLTAAEQQSNIKLIIQK